MIHLNSPHCMNDRAPFVVAGTEYHSVWQWLACDKALSVSDVSGFMMLRKMTDCTDCKDLMQHIRAPEWDLFTALVKAATHKGQSLPNAMYMVEDRVVGTGVTPAQFDHGLLPTGLNLWGKALSMARVAPESSSTQQ